MTLAFSKYRIISVLLAVAIFVFNYLAIPYDLPLLFVINLASLVLLIIITAQLNNAKVSDNILLILAALGVCYSYLVENELLSVIILPLFNLFIGVVMIFLSKFIFKKEIMKSEEIKILFISGLFLGVENVAAFYLIVCFFGVFIALYWRWYRVGIYYSFGISISISLYFCLLFGKNLDLTFYSF